MKYVFKNKLYLVAAAVVDFLGSVIFLPLRIFRKKPENVKNVLLIRLDHIGDFVTTGPLIENIKAHFKNARLTVIVNPAVFELAKNNPFIDEVITYKAPWFSRGIRRLNIADFFKLVACIRNKKFDIGIDPRGDCFSIILMFLGAVKYRAGFAVTGGGFLLNRKARYNENAHAIEKNLDVLRAMDIPLRNTLPQIYFTDRDKDFVDNLLSASGYRDVKSVVIHPFAGTKAKEWGDDKFRQLINSLRQNGYDIFIVGALADKGSYDGVYDFRGKLNLTQLAYLIRRIGNFIGLDSGPANIAASLNVPAVIICSGTNIARNWIPNSPKVTFLFKKTECSPCELKVCPKTKHFCMDDITVEEIIEKIKTPGN